ncbi:acyl-CoA dehydrogenase [Rhodococcus opacus]|uniref:Acyl-CoA dehydrogenase n=2 Tax=Rhodococcus opacus TaxID=37919 RepID=A0A2S8J113_RHOOP|nr:acyl-CoA dehydrogenase family protein [Rhodococcus opacus]PQP20272.1 acyl-CoA dehydrogenase [Rhodococcus opacus]
MTGPATDTEMREFARMLDQVFATDRRAPGEAREFDRELWSTLAELGLTRLTGPQSEGGSDAGWTESAYLLAAASAADLPIAENDLLAGWLLGRSGCPTANSGPVVVRTAAVLDADGTARHVPWARSVDALVGLWEADGTWRVAEFARSDLEVTEAANLASMPRDHVRVDLSAQQGTSVPADVVTEYGHAASVVVRNAHQCLGAVGFTREHELHRHTTALLAWRSEYGSVRYWDEALVAAAAAAGERGLWPLITDG